MTSLYLTTSDQHLITSQKVKIASGDINSVQLCVNFDSMWDNYPARTAVFYTSKDETKIEVLLTDNACVIPSEVLAESCILYVGIRGVSMDGTKVKTSVIVQHKIVPGVGAGATTIEPTMDLYQQYIAAMNERVDPIFGEVKTTLAEQLSAQMAEIMDILTPVVLWENPSSDESFAAQTIEMDLSEYKRIGILFLSSRTGGRTTYFENVFTEKDIFFIEHERNSVQSTAISKREFLINEIGIIFENATDGINDTNSKVKPIKIIGYKY